MTTSRSRVLLLACALVAPVLAGAYMEPDEILAVMRQSGLYALE